jgi:sugar phosphate isomerase/epimerase
VVWQEAFEGESRMIGVSPAFIVSLYGPEFSIGRFCEGLRVIKGVGFSAYQPEIFAKTALPEWMHDARNVHRTASDLGLVPTQFVAHFMQEQFSNPEQLPPGCGLDELKQLLDIVEVFSPCRVLTIPALQFNVNWDSPGTASAKWWEEVHQRLVEKIARYVEVVAGAGLKLAFEILPFSVFGGISRFLALCDEIDSSALGLNVDTGNAWACGELMPALPFELEGRIFGTHLGDNRGNENIKLAPGKGTIPWKPLLENLVSAGYKGSRDIEIGCGPDHVISEYRFGLNYLQSCEINLLRRRVDEQ